MIGTASSRPATMNILICSMFVNSGWRAELSRNLPPKMPKPMAAPRPPRPITRPAAITVALISRAIWGRFCIYRLRRCLIKKDLVTFSRNAHVHDGQDHENERLQSNNEVVKSSPHDPGNELPRAEQVSRHMIERGAERKTGDQQEYEFAGIHIAEQP